MTSWFRVLHQPYPFEESYGRRWRRAALMGLFVGLFLLLFQPFELNLWQTPHKELKILGFGFITFLGTSLHHQLWPRLFPRPFSDAHWTVGREILFVAGIITTIALVNLLYLNALGVSAISPLSMLWMLLITFLVGIFPTAGSVLANYIVQLRKYRRQAAELTAHPHATPPADSAAEPARLTFVAENEKDSLTLAPAGLLFIESSDNYCTIVYQEAESTKKVLLRSSLSRLEGQLPPPANGHSPSVSRSFVRCHRSYVVNLDRVERITGNAQGYKLHLLNGTYQIPVARKYNDTLVAELKKA